MREHLATHQPKNILDSITSWCINNAQTNILPSESVTQIEAVPPTTLEKYLQENAASLPQRLSVKIVGTEHMLCLDAKESQVQFTVDQLIETLQG